MNLPPEIHQHIAAQIFVYEPRFYSAKTGRKLYLDEEAAAKDDLLALSQVSREYRLASLPYLFHTMAFRVNDMDEPCPDQEGCRCRHVNDFRAAVKVFAAMRENIKEVRIRGGCIADVPGVINGRELVPALHRLPKLESLDFRDILLDSHSIDDDDDDDDVIALGPPDLLRFSYIIEEPHLETHAIQILFIMMLFHTISNVHISGLSFIPLPFWMREPAWQTSGPPASDDPSARHIFVLYITDCIQAERFVSELEHGTVIHHLGVESTITNLKRGGLPDAGEERYLRRSSAHLKAFCLNMAEPQRTGSSEGMSHRPSLFAALTPLLDLAEDIADFDLTILGLAACSKLQHLILKWTNGDTDASLAICGLLVSLSDLPSLKQISLCIDVLEDTAGETLEYLNAHSAFLELMEKALLDIRDLEKVAVEFLDIYNPTLDFVWYPEFIREHGPRLFPALHDKGILVVK